MTPLTELALSKSGELKLTIYKQIVLDASTLEETKIEFTSDELKAFEKKQQKRNSELQAIEAEQLAKEAARQSALEKLAALGLTEAEIQALAG